ncbi:hypothetical protein PCL_06513 [Purpureocillium lilacinum]|uniref:Uncharacterized protein n=1 Tax=Purpureocillium lilacinum TaxID=33203 RepID=A0A2U3EMX0_PURLI|nr:hypothetical protein PCL_06513 [Purpureocillium lilacinum]
MAFSSSDERAPSRRRTHCGSVASSGAGAWGRDDGWHRAALFCYHWLGPRSATHQLVPHHSQPTWGELVAKRIVTSHVQGRNGLGWAGLEEEWRGRGRKTQRRSDAFDVFLCPWQHVGGRCERCLPRVCPSGRLAEGATAPLLRPIVMARGSLLYLPGMEGEGERVAHTEVSVRRGTERRQHRSAALHSMWSTKLPIRDNIPVYLHNGNSSASTTTTTSSTATTTSTSACPSANSPNLAPIEHPPRPASARRGHDHGGPATSSCIRDETTTDDDRAERTLHSSRHPARPRLAKSKSDRVEDVVARATASTRQLNKRP